jgi:hypothetical protein
LNRNKLQSVSERNAEIWNAFLDLICLTAYEDLTPNQRGAQLAFFYESEVFNGGHLQYFENQGTGHLEETLAALEVIGATCQRQVLEKASQKLSTKSRPKIRTLLEYHHRALEREYDAYDNAFYKCQPEIAALLDKFLVERLEEFIEFEG